MIEEKTKQELQEYINLIETLQGQKKDLAERIKDIYNELESAGFNSKAVKEVIKAKMGDVEDYKHNQNVVSHYLDITLGKDNIDL